MIARTRAAPRDRPDGGFTLIELLVVIIIIGILAAIAVPVFLNQRQKGYDAEAKSDLRNVATAEETYLTDNPTGYVACDSSVGAANCAQKLVQEVWKASPNVLTAVGVDAAVGFCAVSRTVTGDYFVYDSMKGGLQSQAATSFGGITWPAGTCTNSAARPASF